MGAKNVLNYFEKIDNEEKAYWLGFLYADGNVGSREDKVELSLAEKDIHHIEKFKICLNISNKICYRSKTKSYRISFRSQKCKQDLINNGCIPKKSLLLKFPSEQQVPKKLLKHFIRGYFDGDGWFSNTEKTFQVGIIGTEDFLRGIINNFNFKNNNQIFDVHRKDGAKRFMFSNIEDVSNFLNWIYSDANIYLGRKYQIYLDFIQNGRKK